MCVFMAGFSKTCWKIVPGAKDEIWAAGCIFTPGKWEQILGSSEPLKQIKQNLGQFWYHKTGFGFHACGFGGNRTALCCLDISIISLKKAWLTAIYNLIFILLHPGRLRVSFIQVPVERPSCFHPGTLWKFQARARHCFFNFRQQLPKAPKEYFQKPPLGVWR